MHRLSAHTECIWLSLPHLNTNQSPTCFWVHLLVSHKIPPGSSCPTLFLAETCSPSLPLLLDGLADVMETALRKKEIAVAWCHHGKVSVFVFYAVHLYNYFSYLAMFLTSLCFPPLSRPLPRIYKSYRIGAATLSAFPEKTTADTFDTIRGHFSLQTKEGNFLLVFGHYYNWSWWVCSPTAFCLSLPVSALLNFFISRMFSTTGVPHVEEACC